MIGSADSGDALARRASERTTGRGETVLSRTVNRPSAPCRRPRQASRSSETAYAPDVLQSMRPDRLVHGLIVRGTASADDRAANTVRPVRARKQSRTGGEPADSKRPIADTGDSPGGVRSRVHT